MPTLTHISVLNQEYKNPVFKIFINYEPEAPFVLYDLQGVDPTDADVTSENYAVIAGAHYTGSHTNIRDLSFSVEYTGFEPADVTRSRFDRQFFSGENVMLGWYYDDGTRVINNGYVLGVEHDRLTQTPGTTVRIRCTDPYFYDDTTTSDTFSSLGNFVASKPIYYPTPFYIGLRITNAAPGTISINGPARINSEHLGAIILRFDNLSNGDTVFVDTNPTSRTVLHSTPSGQFKRLDTIISKGGLTQYIGNQGNGYVTVSSTGGIAIGAGSFMRYTRRYMSL